MLHDHDSELFSAWRYSKGDDRKQWGSSDGNMIAGFNY